MSQIVESAVSESCFSISLVPPASRDLPAMRKWIQAAMATSAMSATTSSSNATTYINTHMRACGAPAWLVRVHERAYTQTKVLYFERSVACDVDVMRELLCRDRLGAWFPCAHPWNMMVPTPIHAA